jgi:hypothetical protein
MCYICLSYVFHKSSDFHLVLVSSSTTLFQYLRLYSVEWNDDRWILNWKGCVKKRSWHNFKILSRHSPGVTEETHENFKNCRYPGRDLNQGPPEYEAGALTTWSRCFFLCWPTRIQRVGLIDWLVDWFDCDGVTLRLLTAATNGHIIVHPPDNIWERRWNDIDRENRRTGETPVPVPFCPPQIPHGLIRARTRDSVVRGRRLTAWGMARPSGWY